MGPYRLGAQAGQIHHHNPREKTIYAYPSREEALRKAKELGCEGGHAMGSLWMPCQEHPTP